MIEIIIHSVPVAQPRHRAGSIGGKARMYLPTKHPVHQFKADIKAQVRATYSGPVLAGAVSISCLFLMPRPKNMVWKKRPMPREPHVKKPDTDNLIKAVKDALTGILWRDDCQVWSESTRKEYHAGDESPCVEIKVDF
jgi:Holliday junction resolvase RusA-like endonuclease